LGKAVPQNIKSKANTLTGAYSDKFSKDFEKNKGALAEFDLSLSKEQRNLVAGYIVRIKKRKSLL